MTSTITSASDARNSKTASTVVMIGPNCIVPSWLTTRTACGSTSSLTGFSAASLIAVVTLLPNSSIRVSTECRLELRSSLMRRETFPSYSGNWLANCSNWLVMIQPHTPANTIVAVTTVTTAGARGTPRRVSNITTGLRMKANSTAKAIGTITTFVRARQAMTTTASKNFPTVGGSRNVQSEVVRCVRFATWGFIREEFWRKRARGEKSDRAAQPGKNKRGCVRQAPSRNPAYSDSSAVVRHVLPRLETPAQNEADAEAGQGERFRTLPGVRFGVLEQVIERLHLRAALPGHAPTVP